MAKRHIAVFTPLSVGHVYPALDVCSELVQRGYRVTYPANERFAPEIRQSGAEAIEFKSLEFSYPEKLFQYSSSDVSNYWRMFASVVGAQLIASATATLTELEGFYASNPPDLILYEWFSFAGRIFARHLNCPAIQVCAHFAHHDCLLRVEGVGTTPEPMLEFSRAVDSFMSLFGFEGEGHLWHVEPLNLFFIPREFQYDVSSFDARFRFVGATHGRSSRAPVWKNNAGTGRPLVLISETTSSNDNRFFDLCVEAFAGSKYHVVFSKGPYSEEISAARVPANFEINLEARNREILPSAAVMLCQGGMGTTLESLYYGVPVVALPPTPWHAEVAYRMAELGLGLQVPGHAITPDSLRKAVDTAASDQTLRMRVKCIQGTLRTNPGGRAAVAAIAEFIEQTPG